MRAAFELLARLMVVTALALGCLYFAYHAFQGRYGILAQDALERDAERLETALSSAQRARERMEHKINGLGKTHIDSDLLEERMRAVHGYAHPDERVIIEE